MWDTFSSRACRGAPPAPWTPPELQHVCLPVRLAVSLPKAMPACHVVHIIAARSFTYTVSQIPRIYFPKPDQIAMVAERKVGGRRADHGILP